MRLQLLDPCRYLRGVGPQRAAALERLGVRTVEDLLLHLPRAWYDRSRILPLRALRPGTNACVRARVETVVGRPGWAGRRQVVATVVDDTGRLRVVWYNAWARDVLQPGNEVLLAGPVTEARGGLEMRQPEFERIEAEAASLHGGRIVPLYPLTRGVSQKWLRGLVHHALGAIAGAVPEILPGAVRGALLERGAALQQVHFPDDEGTRDAALRRLRFEELFFLQLLLARRRARWSATPGIVLPGGACQRQFLATLPWPLTRAQTRAMGEIASDLASGRRMQRLLLGDVGAGKTVVAVAALLAAADGGCQGAFLAPTETLALQHAERLAPVCAALGVGFAVLVGALDEAEKAEARARIASGKATLVVGTHALLQEGVRWQRLGLAVIDEQQRFGVAQRAALQNVPSAPHVLLTTATPIPRSLALALGGELDLSPLDEKPPGRTPVRTHVVPSGRRDDMLGFLRQEIAAGRQGYVVLPVIEESEAHALRAATAEFERLRKGPFGDLRLGLLHGRLPSAEREALMTAFRSGALDLLVCTSVVEVGVDVANATLMVVHHPERFGLAQLHQLRGRVGRGSASSYCFLLPGPTVGDEGMARLRAFAATESGFELAEVDLRLRGSGDIAGTRQHGEAALRVADFSRDVELLVQAQAAARAVIAADPELARPEHAAARAHLEGSWTGRELLASVG